MGWKAMRSRGGAVALITALLSVACQPAPPPPAPTVAAAAKPVQPAAGAASPAPTAPAAAAAPTAAAKPAALEKIRVAYSAPTAFQSLSWVAKDRGLFEKYGLDAEVTQIATAQQVAALAAGKIDFGITSADNVSSAILNGADLKLIGLFVPNIVGGFYTRPEIKTADQLKGKIVGASTAGPGIIRRADEYALQKLGLDPSKDVEIRVFKSTSDALNAAISGEIQGIALVPPDTVTAEKAGFNLLYDVGKDNVLYPSGSTYASGKLIKEKPDIVLAYVKAISEAVAVYKADPTFAIDTFLKWAKIDDRDIAKGGWDWFSRGMPDEPKWTPEAMQATLSALGSEVPQAKTADPISLYDNSFVDQLEKAGFYQQVLQQHPKAPLQ